MDVTFKIGALDLHEKLSTYQFKAEVTYQKVITTLDNVEHPFRNPDRHVLTVTLFPMTESEASSLYLSLVGETVQVTYTNPYTGASLTKTMRVTSDLETTFALKSVDGNRRYAGGKITLRAI